MLAQIPSCCSGPVSFDVRRRKYPTTMLGTSINLGATFWEVERRRAGKLLDGIRGQNIPSNARTIDRTEGISTVVSHKTTDLRCKSYLVSSAVYSLGTSFVRALAAYKGETRRDHKIKATYFLAWALQAPEAKRILEWFVPMRGVTPEQEASMQRVVEYGLSRYVEVQILRVP